MEAHSANILRKSGRGASREGGICSGRCGAGGRMGAGAACADGLPMVGRSEFSGNGLRWSVGRRPRKRMCGISGGGGCRVADRGLGPVCSWSRQGVGMSGVGRCAADRRCRVVGQQGGCRAGAGRCGSVRTVGRGEGRRGLSVPARPAWSRCRFRTGPVASPGRSPCFGVEPLFRRARHRVGADRWERRGSAWTLCSGGAGMEPPPFPDGPVASPGRKASHLRAQRPPEGARCSVFGLFLSFSAASRRAGTDAVCKSAVSPLGKSEKVVFLFLLYN